MRKILIAGICILLTWSVIYPQPADAKKTGKKLTLETQQQKISYSVGYHIGLSVKEIANDVDFDIVFQAIKDVAVHGKTQLTEQELRQIMNEFQASLNQRRQEKKRLLGEKNKTAGEKFLKENAGQQGVKVTKTGLQYKVIKQGNGPIPTQADTVSVHYKGTLIDGTEFDSSFKRGQPSKLEVKRLVPGWIEALEMMKVGSKYILYIPPELAYQERGAGDKIGPHAVLVYEVELLGIEPPPAKPKSPEPTTIENNF